MWQLGLEEEPTSFQGSADTIKKTLGIPSHPLFTFKHMYSITITYNNR